jgi:hypothetical protein
MFVGVKSHKNKYPSPSMKLDPRTLALIQQRLDEAERNIQYIRQALNESADGSAAGTDDGEYADRESTDSDRIIEGVFDGQNMQGNDGEEYPVPPNYASKSKLVEGDILKLTIGPDGSFTYKQIGPVERRRQVGRLTVDEHGTFGVETPEKTYRVLLASVTFYKAEKGDDVTILLPVNGEAEWGAVEHIVHR